MDKTTLSRPVRRRTFFLGASASLAIAAGSTMLIGQSSARQRVTSRQALQQALDSARSGDTFELALPDTSHVLRFIDADFSAALGFAADVDRRFGYTVLASQLALVTPRSDPSGRRGAAIMVAPQAGIAAEIFGARADSSLSRMGTDNTPVIGVALALLRGLYERGGRTAYDQLGGGTVRFDDTRGIYGQMSAWLLQSHTRLAGQGHLRNLREKSQSACDTCVLMPGNIGPDKRFGLEASPDVFRIRPVSPGDTTVRLAQRSDGGFRTGDIIVLTSADTYRSGRNIRWSDMNVNEVTAIDGDTLRLMHPVPESYGDGSMLRCVRGNWSDPLGNPVEFAKYAGIDGLTLSNVSTDGRGIMGLGASWKCSYRYRLGPETYSGHTANFNAWTRIDMAGEIKYKVCDIAYGSQDFEFRSDCVNNEDLNFVAHAFGERARRGKVDIRYRAPRQSKKAALTTNSAVDVDFVVDIDQPLATPVNVTSSREHQTSGGSLSGVIRTSPAAKYGVLVWDAGAEVGDPFVIDNLQIVGRPSVASIFASKRGIGLSVDVRSISVDTPPKIDQGQGRIRMGSVRMIG